MLPRYSQVQLDSLHQKDAMGSLLQTARASLTVVLLRRVFTQQRGKDKTINWKHADVAMPILSTHELARNGHKLEYDEDEAPSQTRPLVRSPSVCKGTVVMSYSSLSKETSLVTA